MKMPNNCAIDIGYSYVKIGDDNNEYIQFPSLIQEWVSDGIDLDDSPSILSLNDKNLLVGNIEEGGRLLTTKDFHGSFEWLALMCWSFYLLCKKYETNMLSLDKLGLGLPYFQFREELRNKLGKRKKFSFSVDKEDYVITTNSIIIAPQGAVIMSDYGKEKDVGIIDIGYYTLDIVLMKKGRIISRRSVSRNEGIHEVYKDLDRLLNSRFGWPSIDFDHLTRIIKDKEIPFEGDMVDMREEIDSFLFSYANRIVKIIKDLWGSDLDFLNSIYVAGGGAELLKGHFSDKRFKVVNNPQYANLKGFLKILEAKKE
jgi:plasmid segregation protein ParM